MIVFCIGTIQPPKRLLWSVAHHGIPWPKLRQDMKSLSGTGHDGGVRIFSHKVEIARVRVSFNEAGCCLPGQGFAGVVLTPAAES